MAHLGGFETLDIAALQAQQIAGLQAQQKAAKIKPISPNICGTYTTYVKGIYSNIF